MEKKREEYVHFFWGRDSRPGNYKQILKVHRERERERERKRKREKERRMDGWMDGWWMDGWRKSNQYLMALNSVNSGEDDKSAPVLNCWLNMA